MHITDNVEIIECESPADALRVSTVPVANEVSDLVIDITEHDSLRDLGSGGSGDVFLYRKGNSLVAAKLQRSTRRTNTQRKWMCHAV